MKKIALIGATGFVGSAILKEALGRGHKVTALVRDTVKVDLRHHNLTVLYADVMDYQRLAAKMSQHDAVISAYNPGWDDPELYEETLIGYDSIIYATIKSGVPRLLVVGGAGSLYVKPGVTLMESGQIPEKILPGVKSLAKVFTDYLTPNDKVDWVFLCPSATLEPGERTGKFKTGSDQLITDENGKSHISVEDFAYAMIDELEQENHHFERFTVGY